MLCERAGEALRHLLAVGLPDAQAAVFEVRSHWLGACICTSSVPAVCDANLELGPDAVGAESPEPAPPNGEPHKQDRTLNVQEPCAVAHVCPARRLSTARRP